ncbi:MAG: cytochrome c [Novosphingobium sp.]|nr:cytochrome c [Novosphingobium sp.]
MDRTLAEPLPSDIRLSSGFFMRRIFWIPPLLLLAAAAPATEIKNRITGFRALGAAFKSASDTVRAGEANSPALRKAAQRIVLASRNQYKWFPSNSKRQSNIKTAAKPDIWTRTSEFKAMQDAFARQASIFERTVATGDGGAIRSELRKLGAKCKGCHDNFRESDD